jgi:hypothetical protein
VVASDFTADWQHKDIITRWEGVGIQRSPNQCSLSFWFSGLSFFLGGGGGICVNVSNRKHFSKNLTLLARKSEAPFSLTMELS